MPQPLRGIVGTVGTILVSLAVYSLIILAVSTADLATVLFIEFAYMWAQVSFAAVGLFNVFQWGYADDPFGAGVEWLRLQDAQQRKKTRFRCKHAQQRKRMGFRYPQREYRWGVPASVSRQHRSRLLTSREGEMLCKPKHHDLMSKASTYQ